jgi:hypothetical protein
MIVKKYLYSILNFLILFPTTILLCQPMHMSATGHLLGSVVLATFGARSKFLPKGLLEIYSKLNQKSLRSLFWTYYLLIRILSIVLILYVLFPGKAETNFDLLSFYIYCLFLFMYDISLSAIIWRKVSDSKKMIKYLIRIFIINNVLGGIIGFIS